MTFKGGKLGASGEPNEGGACGRRDPQGNRTFPGKNARFVGRLQEAARRKWLGALSGGDVKKLLVPVRAGA